MAELSDHRLAPETFVNIFIELTLLVEVEVRKLSD